MFKFYSVALSAILFLLVSSASAQAPAECTEAQGTLLGTCVENALLQCGNTYPTCESVDYAISLNEVRSDAISQCCNKAGRKGRKNCLVGYSRTLGRGRGQYKRFVREARLTVREVIRTDCYGNSYSRLF
jgi:hypothetical protein